MNKERIFVNVLKYTLGLPILILLTTMSVLGACGILFLATLASFLGRVTNTAPEENDTHKDRMDDFKSFWDIGFELWRPWKKQPPEPSFGHFESIFNVLQDIRDNTSDKDED